MIFLYFYHLNKITSNHKQINFSEYTVTSPPPPEKSSKKFVGYVSGKGGVTKPQT